MSFIIFTTEATEDSEISEIESMCVLFVIPAQVGMTK